MFVHRVFPHLPSARPGEAGHPLYVHPDQGMGRWDNPDLYRAMYVASTSVAAVGETFGNLSTWARPMLEFPALPGSIRRLAVYELDEERHPLLDLDDAKALVQRSLRPSEIVIRNRPHTQSIARAVYQEGTWAGLSWWSMHRPQWVVHVLFEPEVLRLQSVEDLPGHPAIGEAAGRLAKVLDASMA